MIKYRQTAKGEGNVNKKLFIPVALLLAVGFAVGIKYGCMWRNVFGVECPSCGLSHAWLELIKGNFSSAYRTHPMFYFPPMLLIYPCLEHPVVSRRFDAVALCVLGACYLAIYILKIT